MSWTVRHCSTSGVHSRLKRFSLAERLAYSRKVTKRVSWCLARTRSKTLPQSNRSHYLSSRATSLIRPNCPTMQRIELNKAVDSDGCGKSPERKENFGCGDGGLAHPSMGLPFHPKAESRVDRTCFFAKACPEQVEGAGRYFRYHRESHSTGRADRAFKPIHPDNWLRLRLYPVANRLGMAFHPTFRSSGEASLHMARKKHTRPRCRPNSDAATFEPPWTSTRRSPTRKCQGW